MDVKRLNIYKRLRDFKVPSTVLDNIFSEENDIKILENAFRALVEDGFKAVSYTHLTLPTNREV